MERVVVFVVIAGCVMVFFGVQEFLLSSGTTYTPEPAVLADIEADSKVKNNHITFKDFWALYPDSVYVYTKDKYSNAEPTDTTSVDFTYYPVISENHPYFGELEKLETQYGDTESIPEGEWPVVGDFSVLVKTKKYATVGDIPLEYEFVTEPLSGLFINKIGSLSGEERKLFLESFPALSVDKLLILEEGRKPTPFLFMYALLLLGVLAVVVPIIVIVRKKLAERKPADGTGPQAPIDPVV